MELVVLSSALQGRDYCFSLWPTQSAPLEAYYLGFWPLILYREKFTWGILAGIKSSDTQEHKTFPPKVPSHKSAMPRVLQLPVHFPVSQERVWRGLRNTMTYIYVARDEEHKVWTKYITANINREVMLMCGAFAVSNMKLWHYALNIAHNNPLCVHGNFFQYTEGYLF